MTNQKPPLEFYVLDSLYENERRAYKSKPTGHDSIHVIEHSAYLAEKTKREQFEKLAGEMREALEKIKKRGAGYNLSLSDVNFRLDCDCKDATEALAKFDEVLKGMKNE